MKTKISRKRTASMTCQGRVTVPKWVRDFLGIGPGSELTFELTPKGEVVLRTGAPKSNTSSIFAKLRGCATVKMRTDEILTMTRGG
jgi:AbrB family looped-hinge helix DNA binding protein